MTSELSLEFMTGNPQLGVLSGRLRYINTNGNAGSKEEDGEDEDEEDDEEETVENGQHAKVLSASSVSPTGLPEHRGKILCILSVPAHMIPTDILQFVAPFKRHVYFVRILRPCNPVGPSDPARTPTEYMVLLQMENQASADDLYLQCNGKRFNSFEEARCRVVFVATATFELGATSALPAPGSPSVSPSGGNGVITVRSPSFPSSSPAEESALTVSRPADSIRGVSPGEASIQSLHSAVRFSSVGIPHSSGGGVFVTGATGSGDLSAAGTQDGSTCVICMDRMECHVLTTVCNHSFHVECLVKWQDSPCPVCRFHHNNASEASTCQECQASDNLWVCLICGDVLCGSRSLDHIRLHYTSTLHAYALDIETQQVWDFAGDGFVHRLIHNKADGKLVEIPDPGQTSEERPQFPARLSDVQEERLIHGKLEGLAYQYNTMLTSQLDEQRHFYEKQLNELLEQQEKKRRERREKMVSGAGLISALRQQRRELESKCASAAERLKKVRDETAFLLEVNESLEANREQWSASLEQARQDLEMAKKIRELRVPEMERKVEQLMLRLDAATIGSSAGCRNATSNSGVGDATGAIIERRRDAAGVAATETSMSEGGGEGVGETKRAGDSGKEMGVAVGQREGEAAGARGGGSREQMKEKGGSGATPSSQQGHSHKKKAKRKKGR